MREEKVRNNMRQNISKGEHRIFQAGAVCRMCRKTILYMIQEAMSMRTYAYQS